MTNLTLTVPNISCTHCVHTIQNELSEVKGVSSVEADSATKLVKVGFDSPATEAQIRALLAEIDYPADGVSA